MIRPWLLGLYIVLLAGPLSCVTTHSQARKAPDELQRRVQAWLGMPRDYLEKYWGIAQKTNDMGAGLRYLHYKGKASQKHACKVVFTVDITGTVRGGQWSGDRIACLQFVKELPSLQPRRSLVMVSF